jgi:hypothetical protein
MSAAPYLSVVVTARNDNHGGDLLYRMRVFISGLVAQCERHRLDAELVLVEWNPPEDRPRLSEALDWPASEYCPVRIIEVPHALHARLEHGERLPLFQMIAKNVGIRRARGTFVLATNVDVLLSDDLAAFLARRQLRSGVLYRTDRYDVTADIPEDAPIAEQLALAAGRVIRICRREGTLDLRTGEFYRIYHRLSHLPWWIPLIVYILDVIRLRTLRLVRFVARCVRWIVAYPVRVTRALAAASTAAADSATAARSRRHRVVRLLLSPSRLRVVIGRRLSARRRDRAQRRLRRIAAGRRTLRGTIARIVENPKLVGVGLRARKDAFRARVQLVHEAWRWERARVRLHTNASGDFTLMSAADWAAVRGYAELELFSMHIDGLLLYQAHYAGIKERFIPAPLYHLEHSSGFKPDTEGLNALNQRLERAAIPQITNEQFMDWALEMYVSRKPIVFNHELWGLAGLALNETMPDRSRTPKEAVSG